MFIKNKKTNPFQPLTASSTVMSKKRQAMIPKAEENKEIW